MEPTRKRHPRSDVVRLVKRTTSPFWYARYPDGRFLSLKTLDEEEAAERVARMNATRAMLQGRKRRDLKSGFVYVIAAGDRYVKIGCTNDLTKRLDHIQTHNPDPARIIVAWRGDAAAEAALHRLLTKHRVMREWYPWSDEVQIVVSAFAEGRDPAPETQTANAACALGNARAARKNAARADGHQRPRVPLAAYSLRPD